VELIRTIALCALAGLLACGSTRTEGERPRGPVAGAVAMPEPYAARAALEVLEDGGNAIDAAVCAGFVLAVTHPPAGNLGGGGFLVVSTPERDLVIDAREVAPRAASASTYLDQNGEPIPDASLVGPRAAGVPGSVAGYLLLHERLGTLPRERLLAPAVRLAEEGFRADARLRGSIGAHRALLERFEETKRVYLPGGEIPDVLKQPELANVLRAISAEGRAGFYRGWFAEAVQETCAKYMPNRRRWITIGDLFTYEPKERVPLRGRYRGHEILTMPPPSSGGVVLLQMLDLLERGGFDKMRSEQRLHLLAEAGKRAFADRAAHFGDPDFVEVPVRSLLRPEYLAERFATITMTEATPSREIAVGLSAGEESEQTCHFSVVDELGNAVACTTTLNGSYGCGLAVSGVLLNNEMNDFTIKPGVPNQFGLIQSKKNAVAPGKRPLSSMTPTIVLKAGRPVLVVGSPGGPTIISTVCQVIANHLALGMDLQAAVDAPRVHHQWLPDVIDYETLTDVEKRSLERLGHTLRKRLWPMGDVQAVGRTEIGFVAASDRRGRGSTGR